MPTPRQGYFNKAGGKVPGTTTVIGSCLGWNKQQLMWWANQMGLQGKNHREESQAAADIGTQAHAMVEARIKGLPIPEGDPKAVTAYGEYLEWQNRTKLEIVATEVALVSERHQFGSTIDAVATHEGVYELPDWKSSNDVYADHIIQLAAYGVNWNENNPDKLIERVHLCRFGKEGGFHHHSWKWSDLRPAWEAFQHLLDIYRLKKPIEALL